MMQMELCTMVQFYPEDNGGSLDSMLVLLEDLRELGCEFQVHECDGCGHYDWFIDAELKGPLSGKDIEQRIILAGLEYELVVVKEEEDI